MTPIESPLELYTSDKPIVFTTATVRYWLCVACIPDASPSSFGSFTMHAVDPDDVDQLNDPVTMRHCDKCLDLIYPNHFNHEATP